MGWKNEQDLRNYGIRRSQRGNARSEELGQRVTGILQNMQEQELVLDFMPDGQPNSFSVSKMVDGVQLVRKFSVTISFRGRDKAQANGISNRFCIPPETRTDTIEKKILALFRD